jgi:membrane-bound metal-dependent hydrolase YbcI (DUF457 family)
VNRKSHSAMAATATTAVLAARGYPDVAAVAGGGLGAFMAWWPDIDHRSRGLWREYRDWLHCVEPWAVAYIALAQVPGIGHWLALVVAASVGSHLLGDSFTTAGVPVSIILRAVTGRTWGLKLFDSTKDRRETFPATVTAVILTAAGAIAALVQMGGA